MNLPKQSLRSVLIAHRQVLALSDTAFAQRIGVCRALWGMIRTGQRAISLSILQGVIRAFLDLDEHVLVFLRGEEHE